MKGQQLDLTRADEGFFSHLLSSLEIVVLERGENSSELHLRGVPPEWWTLCFHEVDSTLFDPTHWSPFLQEYLDGPHPPWEDQPSWIEKSGPWTQPDRQGGSITLEATTLSIGPRKLLLIERLGTDFDELRNVVQRARERILAEDIAVKSHRKTERHLTHQLQSSERVKDDALALLQHLKLAAVVLGEDGRITFASDRSVEILGVGPEDLIGRQWEHVFPLAQRDRQTVHEMMTTSADNRETVSFCVTGSRPSWVELEVHQDPRHPGRHIMVLHDRTAIHDLRRLLDGQATFHDLVGKSPAMLGIYQLVRDVGKVDTTVLIEGETGTGKELIARAIHSSSTRKHKPFIAANCAGLTDSILTSQLFGHKRGAFTGAIQDQQGLFEAAEGGTLFLDEIGDIPPQVQTALLRVLQEKEITRLGETKPRKVNVRVVAATHHNLSEDVVRGTFRADLLYRIRIARVQLPPLRDRREDIPLLAHVLLSQICTATGKTIDGLAPETFHRLMSYPWPGNVRELKSAIEFAVISCKGKEISPADLPPEMTRPGDVPSPSTWIPLAGQDEKARLLAALSHAKGNRTEAAKRLGMSRATFYRRLIELNIQSR